MSAAGRVTPDGVGASGVTSVLGRRDVGRATEARSGGAGAIALGARMRDPEPSMEVAATETTVPRLLRRTP